MSNSIWKRTRKLLNDLHLWLGLASGLILFVVCLTGTVYTFHDEVVKWIDAHKYNVEVSGPLLSHKRLVDSVASQTSGEVVSMTIPSDAQEAYQVSVRKEGERRGTNYLVDPYTGEIKGDTRSNASEFFMTVFQLHRWLMLDTSIGRPIVGWSTIVFVVIIITGLVIWVPQKVKNWKRGLKVKWRANWKRVNHDLHNALGLYTAIFLLIMALTGLYWSFDWYRTGLFNLLGLNTERQERSNSGGESSEDLGTELATEQLLAVADEVMPYPGTYRVEVSTKGRLVDIRKYSSGFFASPAPDLIRINRYTGEVVSLELFADKPLNEQIGQSIKALHVGDVFGTFSKIIYFISCLIATSLPVTGVIIWISKLKKKKGKKKAIGKI